LVVGFTMTEIMLLILFALLLALGAALTNRQNIIAKKDQELARLAPMEKQLDELLKSKANGTIVEDVVKRIERQQKHIADLEHEIERLRPMEAAKIELDDIIRELKRSDSAVVMPKDITEQLKRNQQLASDNAALKDEVQRLAKDTETTKGQLAQLAKSW